ncbi:hypothetical protein O4J56_14605 [Nocardiopsis sp. RSe5-2]|uniref:DUF4760 domain-containing protein n=1 Tax=Nocardiopsis endophytica TaxID=3018445 RepID=A0ABT4U4J3_9ACTN|nr:hypothetical protein [Nocardiopsis endophytica]MDA2811871.1 hypothetical protein [Nocardiopsis endophytica]
MSRRALLNQLPLIVILLICAFWLLSAFPEKFPAWMVETDDDGELQVKMWIIVVSVILLAVASFGGLSLLDPKSLKLRRRADIVAQANRDLTEIFGIQWRLLEKMDHAHGIGYLSGREPRFAKRREKVASMPDRVKQARSDLIRMYTRVQLIRVRYYGRVLDELRFLKDEDRRVDRFLRKRGVDPASPEHSWNRPSRFPEPEGTGGGSP